jgi:mono/diheme cytochrome c family protein
VTVPLSKALAFIATLLLVTLALSSCGRGSGQVETSASKAFLQRGATLYQTSCQVCHGGATGGSLKDIPPPHNTNGHTWHHADQQLTEMILNGITFSVEQQKMPAFKDQLSEEDVRAILAYIKTWWTEEQREWQKKATENWGR